MLTFSHDIAHAMRNSDDDRAILATRCKKRSNRMCHCLTTKHQHTEARRRCRRPFSSTSHGAGRSASPLHKPVVAGFRHRRGLVSWARHSSSRGSGAASRAWIRGGGCPSIRRAGCAMPPPPIRRCRLPRRPDLRRGAIGGGAPSGRGRNRRHRPAALGGPPCGDGAAHVPAAAPKSVPDPTPPSSDIDGFLRCPPRYVGELRNGPRALLPYPAAALQRQRRPFEPPARLASR